MNLILGKLGLTRLICQNAQIQLSTVLQIALIVLRKNMSFLYAILIICHRQNQ